MSKRGRQYLGVLFAVVAYYVVHEGAHLVYALCAGVFKEIKFMGLGMQIDVYADRMSEVQMGIFCVAGSIATMIAAYLLVLLAGRIGKHPSKVFKASMYYITIAMLLLDPLYLSVLCGLFGGGDMNGISLLTPEFAARMVYGVLLVTNVTVFLRIVLPTYKVAFQE